MINHLITKMLPLMPKKLVWIFSRKYIAGETIDAEESAWLGAVLFATGSNESVCHGWRGTRVCT